MIKYKYKFLVYGEVLMTTKFIPQYIKIKVKNRQHNRCSVCNIKFPLDKLQIHHIKFRSEGGNNDIDNLTAVCSECHEYLHKKPELFKQYEFNWFGENMLNC